MRFYASGAVYDEPLINLAIDNNIALLGTYAYLETLRKQIPYLVKRLREQHKRLAYMVDSGAFTAWSKGKVFKVDSLIKYYNELQQHYGDVLDFTFVSLDKIPGKKGHKRTAEDFKRASEESAHNYEIMLKQVNGPIKPVYHDGDPLWLLQSYGRSKYISLSANQDLSYAEREKWVQRISPPLLETGHELHGLAMTGSRMLRSTEWKSVDSAAWILWAGMGGLAWVRESGELKTIAVSAESPRNKTFDLHLSTMPEIVRDRVIDALEAKGFTEQEVRTEYKKRWYWNLLMFEYACQRATELGPINHYHEGLFDA